MHRRAPPGLHFILGQARPTGACRSTQTLGCRKCPVAKRCIQSHTRWLRRAFQFGCALRHGGDSKNPRGLAGAPYVVASGIDLDAIREPTCIFRGTARAAAKGFPANVNVAAALSLAGIGPDRTEVEIWADPTIERNIHEFDLVSDSVSFSVRTEGLPSPENPRTSAIVPLSVVATLERLAGPVRIGT